MKKSPWQILMWVMMGLVLLIVGVLVGRQSVSTDESDQAFSAQSSHNTKSGANEDESDTIAMAVEAVRAEPVSVADKLSANGIITAKETAEVSGKLSGTTIEQVLVDVGDTVRAGQVLAVLDSDALQENTVQMQADLATAIATLDKTKADLARVEPLLKIDAVSRQEVDAYRTALRQAQAAIIASEARLKTAQTNLKNTRITAPVSGVISAKNAQVGAMVSGTPLFSIIKNGQLEWQATLSPDKAARIQVGQVAVVGVGTAGTGIIGRVSHLSPTANADREVVVHVVLPIDSGLKSGMYQTGEFLLAQSTRLTIPISALMSSDGYDYILTLSPISADTYKVSRTTVSTGERVDDKVVIALPDGIAHDVMMVKQSGAFLSDGDVVKVVTQPTINNNF